MAKGRGASKALSSDLTERKWAEEALKRQQAYFQQLFENCPEGIAIVDDADRIVNTNRGFETLFGYRIEEIKGRFINDIIVPEDLIEEASALSRATVLNSEVCRKETVRRRKDGSLVDVSVLGYPIQFGNKIVGAYVMFTDLTERKQAEEEIRTSEARYRHLFESLNDAAFLADAETGHILETNCQGEALLGKSRNEIVGMHQSALHPPGKAEEYKQRFAAHIAKGHAVDYEGEVIRKDGAIIPVSIGASSLTIQGRRLVLGLFRDITERKRAEEAFKLQQAYFQQLFDNSPDAIAWLDDADKVVTTNKGFEMLFGYRAEEIKGRSIDEIVVPEDRIEEAAAISRDALNKKVVREETVRKRKDGSLVDVSILAYPIQFGNKAVGIFAIYRDITERKQMEEQLIRSERLAAIGQLASGVAHELRGPLGAIKTAAFYVQRRLAKSDLLATEPKVLEFLDIIDGEVNIANNVISDLIGFSRVAKPTISPVNIGGIIEDALKHVPLPENVNLARDIDKSLPMVMVDAGQIQQVFVNVIFNAVEAMPQGGRLDIRARSKGEFVEVEFTDTGCGILKSDIDNIFDPLFTTKARGIGLGLAVCKGILERHGGDIGVKSKVGKGSTFTVSLPAQVI